MGDPRIDSLHDPYEDQLSAARFKAERDAAVQELQAMRERNIELWMESGMANELATCAEDKAGRLGKLVWRLQNRLARSHRREKALRKGMRMWREKAISGPVRTVSAYDLLPEEDLQALRWVREQGGLDVLEAYVDCFSNLLRECYGYRDLAREYEKRIMPEGMEWLVEAWPRFDDGEPVRIGDEVVTHNVWQTSTVTSISLYDGGSSVYYRWCGKDNGASVSGECVKRPATKALDADGVEIREGETVWSTVGEFDGKRTVKSVHVDDYKLPYALFEDGRDPWSCMCCYLTHRAPVIAADGRPLREGEHVYNVETGAELVVKGLPKPGEYQAVVVFALPTSPASHLTSFDPDQLTHERPVLDADGVPIDEGDTVYLLPGEWCGEYPLRLYSAGDEMVVKELNPDHEVEGVLMCVGDGKCNCFPLPHQLTHTKPEQDSWERIEEDAGKNPFDYCKDVGHRLDTCENSEAYKARDLVRRARVLAGEA